MLSGEIELQCFKFGLCFAGHVFVRMDARKLIKHRPCAGKVVFVSGVTADNTQAY